jgi:5-methylcytosine-specific restriction protein A
MRPGFIIFLVTLGAMAHVYTDGRLAVVARALLNGKTARIAGAAMAGWGVYTLYKSLDGKRKFEFMQLTNEYLSNGSIGKIAPLLHPAFDITQYNKFSAARGAGAAPDWSAAGRVVPVRGDLPVRNAPPPPPPAFELLQPVFDAAGGTTDLGFSARALSRLQNSGLTGNGKRSVSAAKRKYIAASQDWRCKNCRGLLASFFEIDHIVRIADGGSNHISNLAALCLHCHKYKTEMQR